jgi:hypothetical protein
MGSNAYGKAENGYNAPGLKIFYILATRFGISLDWLVLGWGSMFYDKKAGEKTADDENFACHQILPASGNISLRCSSFSK